MNTYTNTDRAAAEQLASKINQAWLDGREIVVNTGRVRTWHQPTTIGPARGVAGPAHVWGNGSVSVDVATRKGNSITQVWAKVGQQMTVEITPSGAGDDRS